VLAVAGQSAGRYYPAVRRRGSSVAWLALVAVLGRPAVAAADEPCQLGEQDCVLTAAGVTVSATEAYRDTVARTRPKWIRAAITEGLALGGGTIWYWLDRERQVADWDFPSLKERFNFEAWRLDSNPFPINFFGHAINGAGFHVFARSNDLSLAASLGYGFATSMAWEYALEFREKISINDVMLTPIAGLTGGEFFHWLGRYFLDDGPTAALWGLSLLYAVPHELDGRPPLPPRNIWHRFRLGYRLGSADVEPDVGLEPATLTTHGIEIDAKLVALPGYARPGRQTRWFADGNVTSLRLRASAADGEPSVDLFGDTIPIGWLRQGLRGSVIVGVGVAYRYRKQTIGPWHDRLGVLHLPGPAIDGDLLRGDWRLHASARVNVDFAGLHALPLRRWRAANTDPDIVVKTILRKHGYYYGWGGSARAQLELTGPYLQVGAALMAGRYASQEGLDRAQENITADLESSDRVFEWDAWVRVLPLRERYYLELAASHTARHAELDGLSGSQDLRRYTIAVGAEL